MIWDSTLIMATIDVVIVLGALTVLYVSFRHRATVSRMQVSRYVYSIATGTSVIAVLYLADLYMMLILPHYVGNDVAMAAMRHLHLNWSWIVVLTSLSCIVAGLVPLLAKLFPRIEGIIDNLAVEVVARRRAEARLREVHDRLELRTAEPTETNRRLVREIAERSRAELEINELNETLHRRVEKRTLELHAAQEELLRQERLATLGQLTATVSHELRNPLGVIRTSVYMLQADLKPEGTRVARALERVERSVIRCDRIIDELLDFTRISELEPEPTVLDDWLNGVLDEQALPAGVLLRRDFGLPNTSVNIDDGSFRRAVINVFDNACQAMLGESQDTPAVVERALTVRTRAQAGRVEVVFEDRGPGIPAEIYSRIFEPMFSTKGFGVGLGLPVVQQIMAQHNGGIEVETEVGHGTTVRLWLDLNISLRGAAA